MARRSFFHRTYLRLSGPGRVGYGVAAGAAGVSKIGLGSLETVFAIRSHRAIAAGKGVQQIYSGARALRSGIRNIRRGLTGGSQKGHPFYGNQYARVSRYRQSVGRGFAGRGRSGYYKGHKTSRYGYVSKPRRGRR
jgi:hypothetical protein